MKKGRSSVRNLPERTLPRPGETVLRGLLAEEVTRTGGINRDPRTHRCGERCALVIASPRCGGFHPQDLVERGSVVLHQVLRVERHLTDHEVDIGLLVNPEVDLSALDVSDRFRYIRCHGAGLRFRPQPARPKLTAYLTDLGHLVGRRDRRVETEPATLDTLDQLVRPDRIGTCRFGFRGLVTGGEHDNPCGLTGTVRQVHGAADHLVGFTWIHTET